MTDVTIFLGVVVLGCLLLGGALTGLEWLEGVLKRVLKKLA